jgi:hypothetical protein
MRSRKTEKIIVITLLLLVLSPRSSRAGIPSDQLRQTADKVLSILQDARLKSVDKNKNGGINCARLSPLASTSMRWPSAH